ncbi:hypothetical protein NFI96_010802, partial [Prochilodus magdalenae]
FEGLNPTLLALGCELNESNKEETFKTDDTNHQHQLALRTMCLGHTAKDEFNIVELVTGEGGNDAKAVPIVTLHAKSMPTVNLSGLDLHPPVTFRLRYGSGPVFVGAEHVALEDYSDEELEDEEMDEEVEEEEEDIEESPVKKVKKNGAGKPPVFLPGAHVSAEILQSQMSLNQSP